MESSHSFVLCPLALNDVWPVGASADGHRGEGRRCGVTASRPSVQGCLRLNFPKTDLAIRLKV